MPPPNGTPARRRPTGVAPAASAPPRARRSTSSAPAARPAASAGQKLVCTAGPNAGSEYPLEGDEVVIGRSAENAIAIPDTSVSRKHVLLRRTPEGWAASDMGSGNGTMVNSSSIAQETVLNNGDVIAMGDTELQFVDEGGAARPKRTATAEGRRQVVRTSRSRNAPDPEAKKKKKKLFIQIGAVVVVGLAGFVGWKVIEKKRIDIENIKRGAIQRSVETLRAMNQDGRNKIRDGKWAEAKAIFESVLASDPNFGGGTVQQYITKCDQEIPNEQHLLAAAEAIKKGELTAAQKEFVQVTPDTLQTERKEKVRIDLDAKVDNKLRDSRDLANAAGDLKAAGARQKMVDLLAMSNDILGVREDQRDAKEFKETAEKAIDRIDHPYVAPPAPKTPWVPVQGLFQNGDQAGALAMANACAGQFKQCKQLMAEIQEFSEKYKKLESMGPAELSQMLELDRRITGGAPSALSKPIATRVVTVFYLKATAAKSKGDWGQAIDYARKVLAADPAHPGAQAIVSDARTQAKDTFLRGYQMKDQSPDEAIVLFKQVMQMTPKDDEYHEKAKTQLDKLKQ